MTPFRIPLKAVLYKEDGVWLAHCLEMDLIGDGPTSDQAFESLKQAIVTQIAACVRNNCIESLFVPAEGRLWRMFAQGRKTTHGQVDSNPVTIDEVTIEAIEARECAEPMASEKQPVPA